MGLANYSREYIEHYAEITRPLYALMKIENIKELPGKRNGALDVKKIELEWTEEAQTAFYKLREEQCSDLVLALPDFRHPFELSCDASEFGYGATLEQKIENKNRIIAYFSRSYTKAQSNYATSEKELLAIVMAIQHFHDFLYGAKFTIFTDHKPLMWLLSKKEPHPRLEHWMILLTMY
jgi:hypothetical protein